MGAERGCCGLLRYHRHIALNADKLDEEGNVIGKTTDGKLTVADRTVIGNAAPDFTGGFNISAYVKGFDFSANFNFMIGNQVYNANKIEFTSSRKYYNRNLLNSMDVSKRWTNVDWTTGELVNDRMAPSCVWAAPPLATPCRRTSPRRFTSANSACT